MTDDELFPALASDAAKAMSALGASKGGKARKNVLSAEERSEIARNAVRARWAKLGKLKEQHEENETQVLPVSINEPKPPAPGAMPYSMFRGTLRIRNMD